MITNDCLERKENSRIHFLLLWAMEVFRFGGSRSKLARDGENLGMEMSGFSFSCCPSLLKRP